MTLRKTLLLAVTFAAILLYITKVELAGDEEKQAVALPFLKIAPQQVEHITITDPKSSFELVNARPKPDAAVKPQGDTSLSDEEIKSWSVQQIKDSEVDAGALNAVLSSIRNIKLENAIKAEDLDKDLSVYGLAQPELTLEFKTAAADETLKFGKLNSYVSKRYLERGTDPAVYLVSNDTFNAAHKSSGDFRNHAPITVASNDIARMTMQSPLGTVTLEQNNGNWKLTSPGPYTANIFIVDEVVRELRSMHASAFIDDAAGKEEEYGVKDPLITVSIDPKKGALNDKPLTIKVGKVVHEKDKKKETHFYLQVSNKTPIFELGADPTSRVVKPLNEWREKQLVKLATDRVDSVEVSVTGREAVTLVRTGDAWKVNGKDADQPFVDGFLRAIVDLEAADFPSQRTDFGFANPTARVTSTLRPAKGSDTAEKKVVVIGRKLTDKDKGTGYFAEVEGMNEPFIISVESFRKITPLLEALVKSEATPAPAPAEPETTAAPAP